jgi:excisionase family DNA binding protein
MASPAHPSALPERLLTARQVAQILNVSLRTVRRRIADGTLPVVHIGGAVRISPEAIATMIKQK